jgi:hypothetical protein
VVGPITVGFKIKIDTDGLHNYRKAAAGLLRAQLFLIKSRATTTAQPFFKIKLPRA